MGYYSGLGGIYLVRSLIILNYRYLIFGRIFITYAIKTNRPYTNYLIGLNN